MKRGTITVTKAKSFIVTLTMDNGKTQSPPAGRFDANFLKDLPQNIEVFYELNGGILSVVSLDIEKERIILPSYVNRQPFVKKQVPENYPHHMINPANTNDPARAPYNFVPLNNEVVISNGTSNYSKFEGLSGYIDIQIESQSPLFIRGANKLFVNNDNLPYIPGSSLRGMIRNLVNITSYGKLDQFNNRTLFRRSSMLTDGKNVNAGFLQYVNGKYIISNATAKQSTTDYILSKNPYSYRFIEDKNTCNFSVGEFQNKCRVWIFTKSSGIYNVSEEAINGYKSDDTRSSDAIDILKSLKEKRIVNGLNENIGDVIVPENLGIPVFYREENGIAISFGHAKYHRLPYTLSIGDHVIQNSINGYDFSETIFGTLVNPSKVFFEDCYLFGNPEYDLESAEIPKILSSPKPTTYQHYLEQPDLNTFPSHQNKWEKDGIKIRGYKNYWHRETTSNANNQNTWIETEEKSKSNADPINPISSNSIFEGRIRFENLSEEELGALIFVIDLPHGCCHKLGMGKPLGLGSVLLSITGFLRIDRNKRYKTMFLTDELEQGLIDEFQSKNSFKNKYAEFICQRLSDVNYDYNVGFMCLWENNRLKKLREILTFKHDMKTSIVKWENRTRYMENGAGNTGVNEFKQRPILPEPEIVLKENTYKKL